MITKFLIFTFLASIGFQSGRVHAADSTVVFMKNTKLPKAVQTFLKEKLIEECDSGTKKRWKFTSTFEEKISSNSSQKVQEDSYFVYFKFSKDKDVKEIQWIISDEKKDLKKLEVFDWDCPEK